MEHEDLHTPFSKGIMAALFAGIVATVLSMVFNSIYRSATDFELSAIINVSSIIFSVPILLTTIGFLYNGLRKYKHGTTIYLVVMALLTVGCLLLDLTIQRTTNAHLNAEFRQLLAGVILISGVSTLFIPYLATHENNII